MLIFIKNNYIVTVMKDLSNLINRKKGRTLPITIESLLQSPRMKIAVSNFNSDPMFMKALLTEFGMECLNVARNTCLRTYGMHSSLDAYEIKPLLRSLDIDDFSTFNIYFSLTPLEAKLYSADPKLQLSPDKRKEMLNKFKKEMMGS